MENRLRNIVRITSIIQFLFALVTFSCYLSFVPISKQRRTRNPFFLCWRRMLTIHKNLNGIELYAISANEKRVSMNNSWEHGTLKNWWLWMRDGRRLFVQKKSRIRIRTNINICHCAEWWDWNANQDEIFSFTSFIQNENFFLKQQLNLVKTSFSRF